ncbi:hypothetical protein J5N97_028376 [Dioscorea zingiberensis]|uniref:Uncharacterized protein n=1 Tax=Dioscorea zingiberensis TaxID=325984 RepID=A0A9D5BZ51_9LILI|nr:hypothetical protein J5N97_028376 [Dioscorea zingiberensis]
MGESDNDDEERLVHVPFLEYDSDPDEEREEARAKVRKYVQMKDTLQDDDGQEEEENANNPDEMAGDGGQVNDVGDNVRPIIDNEKVTNDNPPKNTTSVTCPVDACPADAASSEQINHQGKGADKGKKQKVVVSKGRRKCDTACYGPINILRGAHTGGLIIGRESNHPSSFITVSKLLARRAEEKRQKQNEIISQQSTSALEAPQPSTQQSMTNDAIVGNPQLN